MKTKLLFCTTLSLLFWACNPAENNNTGNDDTSPGVDEYFRVDVNAQHWEVQDDETIGAVLSNFGSGPKYGMTATNTSDTTHFYYVIPYFYTNDTTWSLTTVPSGMVLTYYGTDSLYSGTNAGSLHIQRSMVGSMEVFTGTFNYTGLTIIHQTPTSFSNGEFVIARIL